MLFPPRLGFTDMLAAAALVAGVGWSPLSALAAEQPPPRRVRVAAVVGCLVLAVGGCGGGWEVSRMPDPSALPTITDDPTWQLDVYPEGWSLTQLLKVEPILARSVAAKGRAGRRIQLVACSRLAAAASHTGGWDWGGVPEIELLDAQFYCYRDPREALLHLRKSLAALQERGVTPEPVPKSRRLP